MSDFVYTETEVKDMCNEALKKRPSLFYKENFVKNTGHIKNTGVSYTEFIAQFLIDNIADYKNGIKQITREKSSYYTRSHDGEYKVNPAGEENKKYDRKEEKIAMDMYKACQHGGEFDVIGKIIDYQTPLKNVQGDEAGKIDLLAYNGENLRILELKKQENSETMLRCILEVYTYFQTVDKVKLIKDFNDGCHLEMPENERIVRASALVFENSCQYSDYNEYPILHKLLDELKVEVLSMREENGEYKISILHEMKE